MISLDKMENGLYLVSDTQYTPDRYPVVLNFLERQNFEILDYTITLKKKVLDITFEGFNIYPLDFNDDFSKVLEGLNETYQEMKDDGDVEDVEFDMRILCQNKPFNLKLLSEEQSIRELLEKIRHHLVATDNLVVCDDESLLDDGDKFWLLDNKSLIKEIDER